MRQWINGLVAVMLVLSLGLASTYSWAADKEPPKKKEEEKKEEKKEKDPKDMTTDELETAGLCIVNFTHKPAKPVYHFDYKDKTFHFCSRDCQKAFAADPAKYIKEAKK